MDNQIRFNDGSAYERFMGVWSRLAGDQFVDWLAPAHGQRWLDVGCGNGAFTELIVQRCAPASVDGIDPSEAQLAFANSRPAARVARFRQGNAMAMPFPDAAFDVAVMPLVIFFVPEPAKGVAEMARVVRPGGIVTAYGWDLDDGGFPYAALLDELRSAGATVPDPPSPDASRIDVMQSLWAGAGIDAIATQVITVQRTFADFADYWAIACSGPSVSASLSSLGDADRAKVEARMRGRLQPGADGRIVCSGRANAVKGTVKRRGVREGA